MVGGVQMIWQWERALALAVKGMVAWRRHNPHIPAHITKVYIEWVPPAVGSLVSTSLFWWPPHLPFFSVECCSALAIMAVSDQQWSSLSPGFNVRMKGPAYPHMTTPACFCLLTITGPVWVQNLHHKAMVVVWLCGPACCCWAYIKAFPAWMWVLHQTSVQKSGKRLLWGGMSWPKHLKYVNSLKGSSTAGVALLKVTEHLVSEDA